MAKKESQMKELDRVSKSLSDELKALQTEVRVKRESEEQMKQVLKEYEKTISELIAEKEREKVTYEEDRLRLMAERDQATDDLKVSCTFKYRNSCNLSRPQKIVAPIKIWHYSIFF